MRGARPMGKATLLILTAALAGAGALAGCFHADEAPGTPPPSNNTNRTNNTAPPPVAAVTGGANITGGPNAMQSITINVAQGHKKIEVTFREKGAAGPLPGAPITGFNAVLKDPAGNETATAQATSATIGADVKAGQHGAWTLDVSFQGTPATTVEVLYKVT